MCRVVGDILRLVLLIASSHLAGTYMGRYRRHADFNGEVSETAINVSLAERQILNELGPKACIMEEPCKIHATRKARKGAQPEWNSILR